MAKNSRFRVSAMQDDLLNNQIRKTSRLTREQENEIVAYESEATSVMNQVINRLEAIKTIYSELNELKLKIENIKDDIMIADADFEKSRHFIGNSIDVNLKSKLGQAINKVKSSSSVVVALHNDVMNILEHASMHSLKQHNHHLPVA